MGTFGTVPAPVAIRSSVVELDGKGSLVASGAAQTATMRFWSGVITKSKMRIGFVCVL